ncbi:hypothetical protein RRG08_014569 [Elysia crispata]|uniref:MADF domain-containing protein n=1 Tax=Elysia crispata TaxID=231223 RepID=A0AAE1ATV5_9GAST|nr:hypothetical protein RRG08_014569 [Elysia crispata]
MYEKQISGHTKTKWQRLRNNFSKAIERRAKTPRSGSAATKLQKPWIYEADMEFLSFHLQHHRASSSSLLRESPVADVELKPLSPQLDVSDNPENSLDIAPRSHSSPPRSTPPVQQGSLNSAARPKAKKRDANDLDSAVLSYINRTPARDGEPEDPAIGWFKSLLPMYNSLTSIEILEFQSKVVLELRSLMLAKEQRMTRPPNPMPHNYTNIQPPPQIPMPHNNASVQSPQDIYSTSRASSCSIPEYEYYQDYH